MAPDVSMQTYSSGGALHSASVAARASAAAPAPAQAQSLPPSPSVLCGLHSRSAHRSCRYTHAKLGPFPTDKLAHGHQAVCQWGPHTVSPVCLWWSCCSSSNHVSHLDKHCLMPRPPCAKVFWGEAEKRA